MAKSNRLDSLSRRERQIMDLLFAKGEATAREVEEGMADAPSYSAVRALIAVLEEKGLVRHTKRNRSYVFSPTIEKPRAKRQAVGNLLKTFFDGSPEKLVAALLDPKDQQLSSDEIERIRELVEEKRNADS